MPGSPSAASRQKDAAGASPAPAADAVPKGAARAGASAGKGAGAKAGAPAARKAAAKPPARPAAKNFTITELAAEFDVTPRAIRFYEDVGLLQPERAGRNRVYSHRERTRLKLTLRGKRLGLSLQEIKQLVDMYDSPSDTSPQLHAFLEVLRTHRRQLELQMEDIRITLEEIAQHEERCERLLEAASAAGAAPAGRRAARA